MSLGNDNNKPEQFQRKEISPEARRFIKGQRLWLQEGIGCGILKEDLPEYEYGDCEDSTEGRNNSYIVLGRDRHAGEISGCGGDGEGGCGMIDLVVGRYSAALLNHNKKVTRARNRGVRPEELPTLKDSGIENVDSNWFADAARIYLTQRAQNIDSYLGFTNIKGSSPVDLSAICIKSDCTRVVGRESVRIYAGEGDAEGYSGDGELRANGTPINNPTIELLAGGKNAEDFRQPAVLGNNLISYLIAQNKINEGLKQVLNSIMKQVTQLVIVSAPMNPPVASILSKFTLDNMGNFRNMVEGTMNTTINEVNHLNTALIDGKFAILSRKVYIT